MCWNCKGPHYYRDCPEKEWHGKLEKARDQSDDLHMQLMINSGGYARLSKLNDQQRQEIMDSKPKPREETSTRSPYREVDPKKRRVESEPALFKKPLDGISPPRRAPRIKERVGEWIQQQRELGFDIQCDPAIPPPARISMEGRRKRSDNAPRMLTISTREQGSQVESELPGPLEQLVVEIMEERMKREYMKTLSEKERQEREMGPTEDFSEQPPMGSPPSYTTEIRKTPKEGNKRDTTHPKTRRTPLRMEPEVIYSQKYISDEERMRGLSIPEPINLGHLPPPGIPKEGKYKGLDKQQTYLKEQIKEHPRDVESDKRHRPQEKVRRKSTTDQVEITSYTPPRKRTIKQEAPQEQPKFIVPPEITTAEYLEALKHAKIIANKQGREDIQGILRTVLQIRAQGKKEFAEASKRQTAAKGSSQRGTEPPRQPPERPPGRGGTGGNGGRGGGDDDPSEPDDAGDEEDDSEEDETDSESGEGSIREQLPAELRGQRMYRLNLPQTQERHQVRSRQPNGGGGGGSSPSSSPPPSDRGQNRPSQEETEIKKGVCATRTSRTSRGSWKRWKRWS